MCLERSIITTNTFWAKYFKIGKKDFFFCFVFSAHCSTSCCYMSDTAEEGGIIRYHYQDATSPLKGAVLSGKVGPETFGSFKYNLIPLHSLYPPVWSPPSKMPKLWSEGTLKDDGSLIVMLWWIDLHASLTGLCVEKIHLSQLSIHFLAPTYR